MKKVMMRLMVAAVLCIASQSFSDTVQWFSDSIFGASTAPDIFVGDPLDSLTWVPVSQSVDWAARVLTVGTELEVAAVGAGGTHWADAGTDGSFFAAFDYISTGNPFNGAAIFTRFYNNADWTLADQYVDAGFTTINWPSAVAPATPYTYDYNVGKNIVIPIPEPATMLLFGIGGMGAWLLRRRQQA